MKKISLILLLFLGLGLCNAAYGQTGGKQREKHHRKGKKRGNFKLTQAKSLGHADEFARGGRGRKGIFGRLFKKDKPAWVYKSSGSRKSHFRDNQYLFSRNRSEGRLENDRTSSRQNQERARSRDHGSKSFKYKKFRTK